MNGSISNSQSPKLTLSLLMIILLLAALMQMSTDLYTPSLPAITSALNSDPGTIQFTLSIFMLGFSASHLFYGPLSDRIGRKKPILLGVGISITGSLLCFFSTSTPLLISGRLIQGFGIGCCNSVGRSLARDLLNDRMLAKIGSYVGMVSVAILAFSPVLGGYIQFHLGWRANFMALFILGFITWFLTALYLPETNQHPNPRATKLSVMKQNYLTLFYNKTFLGYTLCACFAGAGIIAYLTVAPFLLQETLGLTPIQFGWLAFVIAAGIFISGFINSLLVLKKGIPIMVLSGGLLMLLAGIIMLLFALSGFINVLVIMVPVALFSIGAGFTFINAFAGAFNPFPNMAGTVGALYGCLQDLSAALVSMIIAFMDMNNQFILAATLLILAILSLFAWQLATQSRS
ncbi:multidrug effflux MFS transporter [Legionella nagasakiensis]|uniref:multidrug effflux MFS transporter n=1 Tax=Legionella nagasakiensis TaxID=535290 RepID=UPI001056809E|nr:multidrug effflux MFS transporter [Legionella nagasakiensis]